MSNIIFARAYVVETWDNLAGSLDLTVKIIPVAALNEIVRYWLICPTGS